MENPMQVNRIYRNFHSIQSTKHYIKPNKHQYRNSLNDTFATWRILNKKSKTIPGKIMKKNENQFLKTTLENESLSIRFVQNKSNSLNKKQQYKGMTLEQYFRLGSSIQSKTFQMINNDTKQIDSNIHIREYLKQPFQINQCEEQNYTEEKTNVNTPYFYRNDQELILPHHKMQSQYNRHIYKYKNQKKSSKVKSQFFTQEGVIEYKSNQKIRLPTVGSETNTKNLAHKSKKSKMYAKQDQKQSKHFRLFEEKNVCSSIINLQFKQMGSENTDIFIYDMTKLRKYKREKQKCLKKQRNRLKYFNIKEISLNIKQEKSSKFQ